MTVQVFLCSFLVELMLVIRRREGALISVIWVSGRGDIWDYKVKMMTNVHVTDVRCSHLRPPTSRDDITNDKSARPLPLDIIWPQLYWNKYHTNNVTSGTIALLTFPSYSPPHRWKHFVQSECRIPLFQIYPLLLLFQHNVRLNANQY